MDSASRNNNREVNDGCAPEVTSPNHCWTVCETRREDACRNGYERLVSTLKGVLTEWVVTDFSTRGDLRLRAQARGASGRGRLLIVGHRTDLERVNWGTLAQTEGLDVLELQFTTATSARSETVTGSVSRNSVPYCSIPELSYCLFRATADDFASQHNLNSLIAVYRTEAHESLLTPLLPLAVLVDGFLAANPQDAAKWFKPGIEAAFDVWSPTHDSGVTEGHWTDLAKSSQPVDRIREMMREPARATPGFAEILMTARSLGWVGGDSARCDVGADAASVYSCACVAVKTAWDVLTSKNGVPRGGADIRGLVETASVGFHVLAAGHL